MPFFVQKEERSEITVAYFGWKNKGSRALAAANNQIYNSNNGTPTRMSSMEISISPWLNAIVSSGVL